MAQQNMTPADKLAQIFNALDSMTVQGFHNVSTLAASMTVLREAIGELQAETVEPKQKK
ncbi:hypothetical protein [Dysosmobacter sp.]|uniref:hypothetical protein n=1 Tax=Dysosmobacter sp. TaxID=2591382 RepID=UPI003A8E41C2